MVKPETKKVQILYFTDHKLQNYTNNIMEFVEFDLAFIIDRHFDVVIFDKNEVVFFELNKNKFHDKTLKVLIVDTKEELEDIDPSICNAWILSKNLNSIHELIELQKERIHMVRKMVKK